MAWLSSTTLQPSDPLTNVNLNNLALDIQNWGGNVNGGGYSLFNCSIAGVLSDPTTSVGDLLVKGPGTPGVITRLPVGADGLALVADHTQSLGVKWGAPGGGLVDPTTTKGDLIVKPATGVPVRLPIGTDNQLLLADSTQTNGLRWATITEFAAPGADTQVQFNKLGVPQADPRFVFNYNLGHVLIGGQPDDGSAAVLQVTGVTHTTMRVRTDQFLSAKAYANPSSLNIPDAGYGAWGYQGGSVYYYWNGSAFVSADISKLGTGLVDPTTTVGDLIVRSTTGTTRFPVGTANGQVLEVDSTQQTGIRWVTPPPSGVSSVFNRTGAVVQVTGDYSASQITNAADTTQSYADPNWIITLNWSKIISAPAFLVSPLTTQGDLVVYGAAPLNGPARLPLGINGQVLTVDSTQQLGVKWSTQALGVTSISPGPLTGAVSLAAGANVALNQTGQVISISVPSMSTSGGMADPTTTIGDLIVHAQTGTTRLPVGTVNGQVLQVDSTQQAGVGWKTLVIPPAGVSSISPGSLTGAVSLLGGTNINLSQNGQVITISAASIGMTDPTTTQGDLIVHAQSGTTRFACGTANGMVLVTDTTTQAGLRWASGGAITAAGSDMQVQVNKSGTLGADPGHTYDYTNHVLYLNADGGQSANVTARSFSGAAASSGGLFLGESARGSMAAPTAIQTGDACAVYRGYGWDGAAWQPSAQMVFATNVPWTSNNGAGYIGFSTNPGGTTVTERMRITAAGNVGIGTLAPATLLDCAGTIRSTAQTIPTSGAGLELIYASSTSTGYVLSYDRNASAYKALYLQGSPVTLMPNVGINTSTPACALDVAGSVRSTNQTAPASGAGVEILYVPSSVHGEVQCYDRGASAFKQLNLDGTPIVLNTGSGSGVGVNTSTPVGKFNVDGGRSTFRAASEAYAVGVAYSPAGGNFYFGAASASSTPDGVFSAAGGAELMRITNAGNVGIGTPTPNAKLAFPPNVYTPPLGSAYSQYQIILYDGGSASMSYGMGIEGSNFGFNSTGGFKFYQQAIATPMMVIGTASGTNVGIGTASPVDKLHVVGPAIALNAISGNANYYRLFCSSDQTSCQFGYWVSGAWYGTGATPNLTMLYTGQVGIGILSPTTPLHVNGTTPQVMLQNSVSTNNNVQLRFFGMNANAALFTLGTDIPTANGSKDFCIYDLGFGSVIYCKYGTGMVGIGGVTTPGYKLDISGDCNISGTYRVNGAPITTGGAGNIAHQQVTSATPASVSVTLATAGYWKISLSWNATFASGATATWGLTGVSVSPASFTAGPFGAANAVITGAWTWIVNVAANAVATMSWSSSGGINNATLAAIYLGTT